jgi:hypothetical protein
MKKDISKIPLGTYCYDENGVCPYWKIVGIKCGYCAYMDMSDEDFEGYCSLLWDQVKECDLNLDEENDWYYQGDDQ